MSEQRKADMEAALAELAFEIELAIDQKVMPDNFQWTRAIAAPDGEPWFAVLTIGKVDAS